MMSWLIGFLLVGTFMLLKYLSNKFFLKVSFACIKSNPVFKFISSVLTSFSSGADCAHSIAFINSINHFSISFCVIDSIWRFLHSITIPCLFPK